MGDHTNNNLSTDTVDICSHKNRKRNISTLCDDRNTDLKMSKCRPEGSTSLTFDPESLSLTTDRAIGLDLINKIQCGLARKDFKKWIANRPDCTFQEVVEQDLQLWRCSNEYAEGAKRRLMEICTCESMLSSTCNCTYDGRTYTKYFFYLVS